MMMEVYFLLKDTVTVILRAVEYAYCDMSLIGPASYTSPAQVYMMQRSRGARSEDWLAGQKSCFHLRACTRDTFPHLIDWRCVQAAQLVRRREYIVAATPQYCPARACHIAV